MCFQRPPVPTWNPAEDPGDQGLIARLWDWKLVVIPTLSGPCLYEATRRDLHIPGATSDVESAKSEVFEKVIRIAADEYYAACAASAYDNHLAMGGSDPD